MLAVRWSFQCQLFDLNTLLSTEMDFSIRAASTSRLLTVRNEVITKKWG